MDKQDKIHKILNSKPQSFTSVSFSDATEVNDWLNKLKTKIKVRFPGLYVCLIKLVSPVYEGVSPYHFIKNYNLKKDIILNIGSGTFIYDQEIINLDLEKYQGVDIAGDLTKLDLAENSVDGIINMAMLEHVPNPEEFVDKFYRVLRYDGRAFVFIPFIQGYHASPDDYQRYTYEGIKQLFKKFEIESITVGGPTSGFLWILQEWLAMFFSFGSSRLYKIIFPFFYILSPLKLLDSFMSRHPYARNISTGFTIIVKKVA